MINDQLVYDEFDAKTTLDCWLQTAYWKKQAM